MPIISPTIISPHRKGGGRNWSSYWKTLTDKVLFLWSGKFNGDNLLSDIDDTVITVTGKDFSTSYIPYTSAATFAVPDNATYEGADTDLMWFDSGGTPKTVAVKQLVNFDYERTIIRYADEDPYHVTGIMILKEGETLTDDEVDALHRNFNLWVYWSGVENENGHYKDNRTIVDVPAISLIQVPPAQPTKVGITFDLNIDEDTVPETSDFSVTGSVTGAKTITDVAISGDTVTLTVSVGFDDESVIASYTQPTDNALRSALGGGKVATFTDEVVTNNLYGPELVTNGAFTTDTGWGKYAAAGTVTIEDGKLKFNAAQTGAYASQQTLAVSGRTYKIRYTIDSTNASHRISLRGNYTAFKSAAGTYAENVVAGSAHTLQIIYGAGTATSEIDNLSIKEVL